MHPYTVNPISVTGGARIGQSYWLDAQRGPDREGGKE